ncbi:MAG: MBL fold metallo-hydrolase, partial [Candidatus Aminicenantes bacterium]|nr:MBL fold metallo-hydrolase [Candidatus Aminicenantes bacterium]
MKKWMILLLGLFAIGLYPVFSSSDYEEDVFKTETGDLKITLIGHATLYLTTAGKVIHIDPVGRYADYTTLP